MSLRLCDERFDRDEGWVKYDCAPGFEQRYLHDSGLMYCETQMRVDCSTAAAVGEISGPWTWWEHGNVSQFRILENASSEQVLSPVRWYATRIVLKVYPPIPIEGEEGLRIQWTLTNYPGRRVEELEHLN